MAHKNIREVMAAQNDLVGYGARPVRSQAGENGSERRATGGLNK
jgi:hypothetical protein